MTTTDTTYVWTALRDELVTAWSDTPNAPLEQRVLDVWERHPQIVVDAADVVRAKYDRGVIRSPWVIFVRQVEEAAAIAERGERPIADTSDRKRAVQRAEQWLRGAGLHYDRETEILDELFGDFGKLRAYAGDDDLRNRLLALWRELRPIGEQIEADAEARAARYRQAQAVAVVPAPESLPASQALDPSDNPFF